MSHVYTIDRKYLFTTAGKWYIAMVESRFSSTGYHPIRLIVTKIVKLFAKIFIVSAHRMQILLVHLQGMHRRKMVLLSKLFESTG